jgi:hypothetical protein
LEVPGWQLPHPVVHPDHAIGYLGHQVSLRDRAWDRRGNIPAGGSASGSVDGTAPGAHASAGARSIPKAVSLPASGHAPRTRSSALGRGVIGVGLRGMTWHSP